MLLIVCIPVLYMLLLFPLSSLPSLPLPPFLTQSILLFLAVFM